MAQNSRPRVHVRLLFLLPGIDFGPYFSTTAECLFAWFKRLEEPRLHQSGALSGGLCGVFAPGRLPASPPRSHSALPGASTHRRINGSTWVCKDGWVSCRCPFKKPNPKKGTGSETHTHTCSIGNQPKRNHIICPSTFGFLAGS